MSEWQVIVSHNASKTLEAIPKKQRERIRSAINTLRRGLYDCALDITPLGGRNDWRLRVGRWRVIFRVDHGNITILVVSVSPRGDAYK